MFITAVVLHCLSMILLDGTDSLDARPSLVAIADDARARVGSRRRAAARVDASRAVVDRKAARRRARLRHQHRLRSLAETSRSRADALERAAAATCCAATPPGVGEPLPVRAVRATMALRANVLAKGFSGIRLETLERSSRCSTAGVHPLVPSRGSVGASGDLAPLAHLALVLIGEGLRLGSGLERVDREPRRLEPQAPARRLGDRARGAAARRTAPVTLGAEGRARADQRHAAVDGGARRWRWPAPSGWRAPPTSPPRCRSTPCAGRCTRSRRASTRRAASRRPAARRPPTSRRLMQRQRHQPVARATAGACRTPIRMRCAAQVHGAARDALAFVRRTVEDRGQRRHRQPDGLRRHRRDRLRRQLSRRADRDRRRPARGRARASSRRSASGGPIGWSIRRSAACPAFLTPRRRAALRAHDGAGHRGRAARPS